MADPIEVLDYWLGDVGPDGWYSGGDTLDADCRDRFAETWQAAFDGGLEHWVDGAVGSLAYIIICDQIARNIHRGNARAFATDMQARDAARMALDAGWDIAAPEPERQFFYMPFMHSEDLDDQALCVSLFQAKMPQTGESQIIHAMAHEATIKQFGRFPFRNEALGRVSTAQELQFLAEGGYGGLVKAMQESHARDA